MAASETFFSYFVFVLILGVKAYSESRQGSEMEFFAKKVNGSHPLTLFAKSSILDVWQVSEYASETIKSIASPFLRMSRVILMLLILFVLFYTILQVTNHLWRSEHVSWG